MRTVHATKRRPLHACRRVRRVLRSRGSTCVWCAHRDRTSRRNGSIPRFVRRSRRLGSRGLLFFARAIESESSCTHDSGCASDMGSCTAFLSFVKTHVREETSVLRGSSRLVSIGWDPTRRAPPFRSLFPSTSRRGREETSRSFPHLFRPSNGPFPPSSTRPGPPFSHPFPVRTPPRVLRRIRTGDLPAVRTDPFHPRGIETSGSTLPRTASHADSTVREVRDRIGRSFPSPKLLFFFFSFFPVVGDGTRSATCKRRQACARAI